jgi:hypothetical protein
VLSRSSADSFFPASLLRRSHAGRSSRRSFFFGSSGASVTEVSLSRFLIPSISPPMRCAIEIAAEIVH